jgi:hypothetical protein
VNEMETILMKSFSNSRSDMIMMAPPGTKERISSGQELLYVQRHTLIDRDEGPEEEGLRGIGY